MIEKEIIDMHPDTLPLPTYDELVKEENVFRYPLILGGNIRGGKASFGADNNILKFEQDKGLWLGNANFDDAPFKVDLSGNLSVTGGTITGGLVRTAASGSRVEMETGGMMAYDSDGKKRMRYSTWEISFYGADETGYGFIRVYKDENDFKTLVISSQGTSTPSEYKIELSTDELEIINAKNIYTLDNDSCNIGTSSKRFSNIYLVNDPDVSSGIALKESIKPTSYGLKDVLKLQPKEYKMKKDQVQKIGLIAEEVKKIIPEASPVEGSYRPTMLIPILIKSIQELNEKIKILENKLNK